MSRLILSALSASMHFSIAAAAPQTLMADMAPSANGAAFVTPGLNDQIAGLGHSVEHAVA